MKYPRGIDHVRELRRLVRSLNDPQMLANNDGRVAVTSMHSMLIKEAADKLEKLIKEKKRTDRTIGKVKPKKPPRALTFSESLRNRDRERYESIAEYVKYFVVSLFDDEVNMNSNDQEEVGAAVEKAILSQCDRIMGFVDPLDPPPRPKGDLAS